MSDGLRLNTLRAGQRGLILGIEGNDAVAIRLMEMGLTDGEEIEWSRRGHARARTLYHV